MYFRCKAAHAITDSVADAHDWDTGSLDGSSVWARNLDRGRCVIVREKGPPPRMHDSEDRPENRKDQEKRKKDADDQSMTNLGLGADVALFVNPDVLGYDFEGLVPIFVDLGLIELHVFQELQGVLDCDSPHDRAAGNAIHLRYSR